MGINFLIQEMEDRGATGVDFTELFTDRLVESYTKEELAKQAVFPKTNRRYWKIGEGGVKIHIP